MCECVPARRSLPRSPFSREIPWQSNHNDVTVSLCIPDGNYGSRVMFLQPLPPVACQSLGSLRRKGGYSRVGDENNLIQQSTVRRYGVHYHSLERNYLTSVVVYCTESSLSSCPHIPDPQPHASWTAIVVPGIPPYARTTTPHGPPPTSPFIGPRTTPCVLTQPRTENYVPR